MPKLKAIQLHDPAECPFTVVLIPELAIAPTIIKFQSKLYRLVGNYYIESHCIEAVPFTQDTNRNASD